MGSNQKSVLELVATMDLKIGCDKKGTVPVSRVRTFLERVTRAYARDTGVMLANNRSLRGRVDVLERKTDTLSADNARLRSAMDTISRNLQSVANNAAMYANGRSQCED